MCIQAITPTQASAAFASRHSRRIDSALVSTGLCTIRTGTASAASSASATCSGVLVDPAQRRLAVQLLAPGQEPDLELAKRLHDRAPIR